MKNGGDIARHVENLFKVVENQQDALVTDFRGNQFGEG